MADWQLPSTSVLVSRRAAAVPIHPPTQRVPVKRERDDGAGAAPTTNEPVATPSFSSWQWLVDSDNNRWKEYAPEVQATLEGLYRRSRATGEVEMMGQKYELNTASMRQTNFNTGFSRTMRRCHVAATPGGGKGSGERPSRARRHHSSSDGAGAAGAHASREPGASGGGRGNTGNNRPSQPPHTAPAAASVSPSDNDEAERLARRQVEVAEGRLVAAQTREASEQALVSKHKALLAQVRGTARGAITQTLFFRCLVCLLVLM